MKPNNQLQPGAHPLPPNCRAFVRDGKVIVSIKKRTSLHCDRCRDCKFFSKSGYNSATGNRSSVCTARPKTLKFYSFGIKPGEVFYKAHPVTQACSKFQPKNPEQ